MYFKGIVNFLLIQIEHIAIRVYLRINLGDGFGNLFGTGSIECISLGVLSLVGFLMGILWTFMGQSKGYTIFAGLGELVGGLLLLSRYTSPTSCVLPLNHCK